MSDGPHFTADGTYVDPRGRSGLFFPHAVVQPGTEICVEFNPQALVRGPYQPFVLRSSHGLLLVNFEVSNRKVWHPILVGAIDVRCLELVDEELLARTLATPCGAGTGEIRIDFFNPSTRRPIPLQGGIWATRV